MTKSLQDLLPEVFAIPEAERERVNMRNSPSFLGYTALGAETTATRTDLREQYDFGSTFEGIATPWKEGDDPEWRRLEGRSQYPAALPGFQKAAETYIAALDRVSRLFLGFVAESLSLPADTFDSFLGRMHRLKVVKYPPSPQGSPRQGVGPHKDSTGLFTFLAQDNVGGLQVLSKGGEWIAAPPARVVSLSTSNRDLRRLRAACAQQRRTAWCRRRAPRCGTASRFSRQCG